MAPSGQVRTTKALTLRRVADRVHAMKTETPSRACGKCVHQIPIPGNCHIGCANKTATPTQRRWPGCGVWPLNFDSNTVQSCDGYSEDPKDRIERKENPMEELLRLLMH